jgi:4-amino-4-deoxy-L-arabinose transferase-like glycosyltransferase
MAAPSQPPESRPVADENPRYARPALAALLLVTAVAYLWDIDRNGWGNSFYAAAVQAGSMDWSAFFFGGFDPAGYITVDKPPVALWIMALSARIAGFSSWSMLAPQALLGVASVALLYATVRRVWDAPAGLLAAAALATAPAAALMFRFNNPDAALTLLLVAAAYTTTRALERGALRWLLATAVLVGLAFLTKQLQAMLVVPGLALAYLVAAPGGWWRRTWHVLAAGAVMAASGLWWPALVDAIPASDRPYVGGSTGNSMLELTLGYNGVGRLTGEGGGMPGGAPGAAPGAVPGGVPAGLPGGAPPGGPGGFGGEPGPTRLFNADFAGWIAWLVPAALLGVAAGVWLTRGAARTDPRRASLIVWSGWFAVTAGVFSFAQGIVHSYYSVALAPAVAALAAMCLPALWRGRRLPARLFLAASAAGTATTAWWLLGRTPDWWPWLRWTVLVAGLAAAAGLLLLPAARRRVRTSAQAALGVVGATAVLSGLAASTAWSAATIGTAHSGSVPMVGPADAAAAGLPRFPGGTLPTASAGQPRFPGAFGGGPGAQTVAAELVTLLAQDADRYEWVAAATSSMSAAPLQLASGHAVMSLGGFGGQDPAITLDEFKRYVAEGRVHYFVGGGPGGPGGGFGGPGGVGGPGRQGGVGEITSWVTSTFEARTVGGQTVYDLTAAQK